MFYETIDVIRDEWVITNKGKPTGDYEYVRYEIKYSKLFNHYKVKCYGLWAKDHITYKRALEILNQYKQKK